MSYQYNSSNSYTSSGTEPSLSIYTGKESSLGSAGLSGQSSDAVNLGTLGDIITGTVLQTGDTPVVEMNGTPVRVRSDVLNSVSAGEQIYLRITGNTSSKITLQLVNQEDVSVTSHNGTIQTEILKNTTQFVEQLKQTQAEQNPEYGELSKEATLLSENMTDEEKQQLKQMGIDLSSADLTVVKSLLSQMRGQAQEEDLQNAIDSVRQQIILENPTALVDGTLTVRDTDYDIQQFTEELSQMLPITEDQTAYLIQNQLPLTMDNLYKSEFTGTPRPQTNTISEDAMEQMQPQIQKVIQTAGLPVDEEQMQSVRFLLKHQLPVTTDSLKLYQSIQDMNQNNFSTSQLTESAIDYIAEQSVLSDGSFQLRTMDVSVPSASKVASQLQDDLSQIRDDSFYAFAAAGLPYTLENLSAFCATYAETNSETDFTAEEAPVLPEESLTTAITAHRQLEEIRLKMTWEAGFSLAKEDIQIRARELTQVVDALKQQERDAYKEQYLADGILPSKDDLKQIEETNTKMQELPSLPAASLAFTLFSGTFTINRLHEEGTRLSSASITAKLESYETLMTAPRKDMGDSIQKAFQNVDAILEDMELPATEDNQRAVRILGYSQMEISPENILQVKDADQSVQTLIQNLQPSVVLHMVQDGINPLDMPIDKLNELALDYIQENDIADEEKYSAFLQKLDRKGTISAEERKGYIGVYRLLDKVVKSKGKDIGTVLRNGQSLTLQSLLTAHRSNRHTGMDTSVSDTLGAVDVQSTDTSISDAITTAATHYNQGLTEQLFQQITPDIIDDMTQEAAAGTTLEEFFDTIKEQLTEEPDIESNRSDTESSSIFDDTDDADSSLAMENLEFQNLDYADYQFMKEMNIFPSMTNIFMTKELRQGNPRIYDKLSKASDEISDALDNLDEHLTSSESMEQAYSELEANVTDTVHALDDSGTITAMDIQSLKMIRSGLKVLQKMSRQHQFQIPFSVDGEWNIIHLSIIEGGTQKGSIQAELPTRDYGTISTSLNWVEDHFEGTYSADTDAGIAFLKKKSSTLADGMEDITHTFHSDADGEAPTTSELYDMSKKLVLLMKQIAR